MDAGQRRHMGHCPKGIHHPLNPLNLTDDRPVKLKNLSPEGRRKTAP